MKKKPFIKTSDEGVAKILREAGYPELKKEGSLFVFINDNNLKDERFSEVPLNKCSFSKTMCL